MVSDRIVADTPEILHSGRTSVPPTQHVSTCYFVEKDRVRIDALALEDGGGALRERHRGRVKVVRPRSGQNRSGVHIANPTPPLPGLEFDSPERPLWLDMGGHRVPV
jgi:hypothetical protein